MPVHLDRVLCVNCRKGLHNTKKNLWRCKKKGCECKCQSYYFDPISKSFVEHGQKPPKPEPGLVKKLSPLPKAFQKLQDKVRFHYHFERDLFPLVFPDLYGKLKKEKNMTYIRLKELITADLKKIKKKKIKSYDLYFPINIKAESKIAKFKLKDIEVDFIDDKKRLGFKVFLRKTQP